MPLVPGAADGPRRPLDALPCRHVFHAACVSKWIAVVAACPLCRSPVAAATAAAGGERGGMSGGWAGRFRGEAVPAWVHHRLVGV